jgi:hypothetical protein
MNFWTQNSWTIHLIAIFCELWYNPLIDGVYVKNLKLIRYHSKEFKGPQKTLIEF